MKALAVTLIALTLTGLALYSLKNETRSVSLLTADKGFLYDVKVCGTENYNLDLVSFTNDKPVKSRTSTTMFMKFTGKEAGVVQHLKLNVSRVVPLFSQTYNKEVSFNAGEEATFDLLFSIPMIPVHFTVDVKATLYNDQNNDLLTVCGKLDV